MSLADWGRALRPGEQVERCRDDAALAAAAGRGVVLASLSGDVHRALGTPHPDRATSAVTIDLIECRVDGKEYRAAAQVVARRPGRSGWWRGPIVLVMVSGHLGRFEPAPRAHPGDGLLDVIEVSVSMGLRQRWMARRRARTGSHLPHPEIATTRARDLRRSFDEPLLVLVDGVTVGITRHLDVAVVPAAYEHAV